MRRAEAWEAIRRCQSAQPQKQSEISKVLEPSRVLQKMFYGGLDVERQGKARQSQAMEPEQGNNRIAVGDSNPNQTLPIGDHPLAENLFRWVKHGDQPFCGQGDQLLKIRLIGTLNLGQNASRHRTTSCRGEKDGCNTALTSSTISRIAKQSVLRGLAS